MIFRFHGMILFETKRFFERSGLTAMILAEKYDRIRIIVPDVRSVPPEFILGKEMGHDFDFRVRVFMILILVIIKCATSHLLRFFLAQYPRFPFFLAHCLYIEWKISGVRLFWLSFDRFC